MLDTFLTTYREELEKSVREHPQDYCWPIENLPIVFEKMKVAIVNRSFNKDSKAFRATCKRLKIKYTYRDIETFIGA